MITRTFDPRDDEAIVALYDRTHRVDATVDATSLDRWRALRAFPNFEGGRRFRVVEDARVVVALLTSGNIASDVMRARVLVDPRVRRQGIATKLFAECVANARAAGIATIESFVSGPSIEGRAFTAANGFEVLVRDLFLSRPPVSFDAPDPEGVKLRPWDPARDVDAWAAISNTTLARDAGFHPQTRETLRAFAKVPGFFLWLAENSEGVVGFCHVDRRDRIGNVQSVGVAASCEGRGIGAALVSRAIETLRKDDVERIELCTEENNTRAQRLYARAGFKLARDVFTMIKRL
jgi:mycothiol synthase